MAATDSIRDHVQTLEDQLAQATNLAHCFAEATALTEAPPWVSLLIRQNPRPEPSRVDRDRGRQPALHATAKRHAICNTQRLVFADNGGA